MNPARLLLCGGTIGGVPAHTLLVGGVPLLIGGVFLTIANA